MTNKMGFENMQEKFGFFSIIILTILVTTVFGCTSSRDKYIEEKLNDEFLKRKSDNNKSINLTKILGEKWRKVCIPEPYQTQKAFESMIGEKVNYYSALPEGTNILIFYRAGDSNFIHVDSSVMSLNPQSTICTSIKNPYIFFEVDKDGQKKYFFNDKG